jgi:hypothetical protein
LAAGYARFFEPYNGFYGTLPLKPASNTTASAAPAWWSAVNGSGIDTSTAINYYTSDQNIGHRILNTGFQFWAGAIKLINDSANQDASTRRFPYNVLITNNATVLDNNATITLTQANGRGHALAVTGSFLSRDGVSLGTSISNTHIITGSVNVTGSLRLTATLTQGINVIATGQYAHAQGLSTSASGDYSHAEGLDTSAIGVGSHTNGYSTIASASYQTVFGIHNVTSSVEGAFIVGNGSPEGGENSRRNLLHVGGTSVVITGSLDVSGSATIGNILVLTPRTTTPVNPASGSIIVSGSGSTIRPYFWDGNSWIQMFT